MLLKEKIVLLFHIISFVGLFCLLYLIEKMFLAISRKSNEKVNVSITSPILKLFSTLFNEPAMLKEEKALFYKYLDLSNIYFEFGSGGSTYQAARRNKKIYSVESDIAWHKKIQEDMKNITNQINKAIAKYNYKTDFNPDITYITIDLHVRKKSWGWPGRDTRFIDWIKYTRAYNHSKYRADFILIDGRFRVACGLNVFKQIDDNVFVYIHDFNNRKHYHILLDYFDVVEKAATSVVLRKKSNPPDLSEDLIIKYENTPSLIIL